MTHHINRNSCDVTAQTGVQNLDFAVGDSRPYFLAKSEISLSNQDLTLLMSCLHEKGGDRLEKLFMCCLSCSCIVVNVKELTN